jgi:hypothetical protein
MVRTALVAVLLLASMSTARADGFYFSEGLGATRVHDELSTSLPDAFHARVALGMRRHEWAYELYFAGHFNDSVDYNGTGGSETNLVTGGLSIKYIQPIAPHLELYLRGTASVGATDESLQGYSGRGLGAGAGIQLKGKGSVLGLLWWPLFFLKQGPRMTAALWLDSGYEFYRLQPGDAQRANPPSMERPGLRPGSAIDAQLSTLTFGFALGSDF